MSRPFGYGRIPDSWHVTELRAILDRSRAKGRADLPLLSVNLPIGVLMREEGDGRPAPSEDRSAYQVVRKNDLVMNQLGKPHGSLGISPYDGIISPAYFVARLRPSVWPKFVHYLLRTRLYISEYERRGKFMPPSQFDISWEEFRTIPVVLPSLPTQQAIANYLDRETARIDALIAAKRRMVELLEERRKARISAIVWSSEDGSVRLKHLTPAPTSGNRDHSSFTFSDSGVACLRGLNVRPGLIDRANLLRISSPDHLRHRGTRLRHGDVVIVRSGLAGSAAVVPEDLDDCNCVDLVIVRRSPRIIPKYLEYVLNSREARAQVEQRSVGALLTHFNAVDVADLLIPFRTISRQSEVVKQLEAHESEFVQMRSLNARQMHLLQERRQALITAAVTGQLDISEAA